MSSRLPRKLRFPTVSLPAAVRASGEALLDQQMWCWGCDVRRAEGNLLAEYGCTKRPSPDPRFHSAYTFPNALPGGALTLWGWQERDLSPGGGQIELLCAYTLLCAACRWIADYEGWVMRCCKPWYRAQAIEV